MRRIGPLGIALLALGLAVVPGCGDDDGGDGTGDFDAGPGGDMDGGGGDSDAGGDEDGGGSTGMDGGDGGGIVEVDGGFLLPDGAVVACVPAMCQGRIYACGDCLDNDDDGLIDSMDPDCLGPCDNSEDRLSLEIPGIGATCNRDCYFDQDSGSGNDMCSYSLLCDPLSPGTRPPPGNDCTAPPDPSCAPLPAPQQAACEAFCGPLVPNGCDCYGCCDIGGDGDNWVFIGSVPETGQPACTIAQALARNYDSCRPCTPNLDCSNDCGRCELCLGKGPEDLPDDCFPPPPVDGGTPVDDGGTPIDAGPPVDGGTPVERCEDGRQACGLPGDPACPGGYYCLTGCCIFFG